jgi:acyl carrier protein
MTQEQIYSRLTDVMRDVFDDETLEIGPETTAENVEGWDSQAHVTLMVAVEARFKIRFKTSEIENLKKVDDLVQLIAAKSPS